MIAEVFDETVFCAKEMVQKLEHIECCYWMQYYNGEALFPSYASIVDDGMMCAIPEVEVLVMNRVLGVGIKRPIDEAMVDHMINFYKVAGSPRFMIQLPGLIVTDSMRNTLEGHGFKNHNEWTKLYREVAPAEITPTPLQVRKIGKNEAPLYGQLIFDSFDWKDPRLAAWLATTVGAEGYHHYLVYKGGEAIAGGALYVQVDMASMAFAGTVAAHRGFGAQKLLLETRLNAAYQLGAKVITAETAKHTAEIEVTSFKNIVRAGFRTAYHRENWLYTF